MSDKKISNDGTKKKNENRTSITVVVLGDGECGNSKCHLRRLRWSNAIEPK